MGVCCLLLSSSSCEKRNLSSLFCHHDNLQMQGIMSDHHPGWGFMVLTAMAQVSDCSADEGYHERSSPWMGVNGVNGHGASF